MASPKILRARQKIRVRVAQECLSLDPVAWIVWPIDEVIKCDNFGKPENIARIAKA